MLTRPQQILIKRAQKEAALEDGEYREALQVVSGCRSTTDPRMTDRDLDRVLAYFEAIFWRKVDSGELQAPCNDDAVFRERRHWATKNPRQETSRDRFCQSQIASEIAELERGLGDLGLGSDYCAAIRARIASHATGAMLYAYRNALQRMLRAKRKKLAGDKPASTSKA